MGALDGYNMPLYEEQRKQFATGNAYQPKSVPNAIITPPQGNNTKWGVASVAPAVNRFDGALTSVGSNEQNFPLTAAFNRTPSSKPALPPVAYVSPRSSRGTKARGKAPLPVNIGNPASDPPPGFGDPALDTSPRAVSPLITEQTDAQGLPRQAAIVAAPDLYDPLSKDGGVGFTTNPDGTIDRMLTLRSRTPQENAAYAKTDAMQAATVPALAEAPVRLKRGDVGYTGSQQEWEDNNADQRLLGGGLMSAAQRGALLLDQQAKNEAEREHNLVYALGNRNAATSERNADSTAITANAGAQYHGALSKDIIESLPGKLEAQRAGIDKTRVETAGLGIDNQYKPALNDSLIENRKAETYATKEKGRVTAPLAESEIKLRGAQAGGIPDKKEVREDQIKAKKEEAVLKVLNDPKAVEAFAKLYPGLEEEFPNYVLNTAAGKVPVPVKTPALKTGGFLGVGQKTVPAKVSALAYADPSHPAMKKYPDAKLAPDGNYYVNRGGQFFKVNP